MGRHGARGRHRKVGAGGEYATSDPGPLAFGAPAVVDSSHSVLANASGRQLVRNFASGYISLAVGVMLSFLLTPIVLNNLGTSLYGLWILVVSIGTYIGILDAGVATAAVQQIAAALAVRDEKSAADIFATIRVFFVLTALGAVSLSVALVPLMGVLFHIPASDMRAARLAIVLMGICIAIGFLVSVPNSLVYGAGRSDRLALIAILSNLAIQGGQIAVVLAGGELVSLFVVQMFGGVGIYAATSYVAKRMGLPFAGGRATRATMRRLMRHGSRNMAITVGGIISYNLDAVVIGAILPVSRVAPYDLALSTANLTRSASTAGTNLLLPAYAHSSALDDRGRQFRLYSRAVLISMTITVPMVVALIAFGEPLLRLWLGRVPPQTYEVVVGLNAVFLLQLPGHQSMVLLTGIGRHKILARVAIPFALVNLGLSVVATWWLGPIGPAIGSLLPVIILDSIALPIYCCRCLGVSVRHYLRQACLPLAVPVSVATSVAGLLVWQLNGASDRWAPLEAVAVTVVAWAAFVPVLWRLDPTARRLMARFLHRVGVSSV